jgi:NAD(P)-dependent dehydrogenase (short-subunit alcohol dehydrogenase family)
MAYRGFDLTGKVALVTGGNGGIGLGMAEALAQAGAAVAIWGTSEAKNRAAADRLGRHGGRVLALRGDVADEAAVERAFGDTLAALGRVDACFANAGIGGGRDVPSWRPRGQHYAATKAGLIAMARGLAVELARHGIRANAILPGWIETDMTADVLRGDRFVARVLPRVPLRRWGVPEDFGALAVYLASDASAYHTGDTFCVDGGYSRF